MFIIRASDQKSFQIVVSPGPRWHEGKTAAFQARDWRFDSSQRRLKLTKLNPIPNMFLAELNVESISKMTHLRLKKAFH